MKNQGWHLRSSSGCPIIDSLNAKETPTWHKLTTYWHLLCIDIPQICLLSHFKCQIAIRESPFYPPMVGTSPPSSVCQAASCDPWVLATQHAWEDLRHTHHGHLTPPVGRYSRPPSSFWMVDDGRSSHWTEPPLDGGTVSEPGGPGRWRYASTVASLQGHVDTWFPLTRKECKKLCKSHSMWLSVYFPILSEVPHLWSAENPLPSSLDLVLLRDHRHVCEPRWQGWEDPVGQAQLTVKGPVQKEVFQSKPIPVQFPTTCSVHSSYASHPVENAWSGAGENKTQSDLNANTAENMVFNISSKKGEKRVHTHSVYRYLGKSYIINKY